MLIVNIQKLKHLCELPKYVVVEDLGCGDICDIVNLLKSNNVIWHKGCKNQVDNQKVKRAQLKKKNTPVNASPVKTCRVSNPGLSQGSGVCCQSTE